ncbi:MAG TPA: hypothetical protein VJ508_20580, partial [Saprospiraceae bacterium]|nr:hypothetical protein [Saprospiraceae bacterium]
MSENKNTIPQLFPLLLSGKCNLAAKQVKFTFVNAAAIQYLVRMSASYTVRQFAAHLLRSHGWSSFHSPYLFDLFSYCCDDHIQFNAFRPIEEIRMEWLLNKSAIQLQDHGAGSRLSAQHKIKS